jgi:tRNA(Ile)-lysidine synthase
VLFRRVAAAHALQGVVLAHHADDQAETVLVRLIERSGPMGLGGMAERAVVGGLVVLRPLLRVPRDALREYLRGGGQAWREDASNASDAYLRNRVRKLRASRPGLDPPLLELAEAARSMAEWVRAAAPWDTPPILEVDALRDVPLLLARETARRWLAGRGVPPRELTPDVLGRLVGMACDAASPPRQHFPGGVLVRRRGGRLFVDKAAGDGPPGAQ